jgi:hypothetical protein
VTLALLSLAFDRHLWEVGALAAVFVLIFAFIDAYDCSLYSQGLDHAQHIEKVLQRYYDSMTVGKDDPEVIDLFETELEAYMFGLISNFVRFRLSSLKQARPRLVLVFLYSVLFSASLASIALILTTQRPTEALSCVPVEEAHFGVYRCVAQPGK